MYLKVEIFSLSEPLTLFDTPLKRGSGIAQLEPHFSDVIQTLTDHLKQKNRFIQKNPTKLHKGLHYLAERGFAKIMHKQNQNHSVCARLS